MRKNMNFWEVAAVSVSGEGTAPPDVGKGAGAQPLQLLPVAFWLKFSRGPTFAFLRMLGGPSCFSQIAYRARRWFLSVEDLVRFAGAPSLCRAA